MEKWRKSKSVQEQREWDGGGGRRDRKRSTGTHAVNLIESRLSSHAAKTGWGSDASEPCGRGRVLGQQKSVSALTEQQRAHSTGTQLVLNQYWLDTCMSYRRKQPVCTCTRHQVRVQQQENPTRPFFTRKQNPNFVKYK